MRVPLRTLESDLLLNSERKRASGLQVSRVRGKAVLETGASDSILQQHAVGVLHHT